MAQGSLTIPTTGSLSGQQLVIDINSIVNILSTNSSGATDPSTLTGGVQPYSFWLDTSVSPAVLRMRNGLNTGWATMGTVTGSNFVPDLTNSDIVGALGYTPVNKAGDSFTGDVSAPNFNATSDANLKSNVEQLKNALALVQSLRGVSYIKDGKPEIGMIAQEVQPVLPQIVGKNDEGYLTLAYGNVVGLLVEAIKELATQVAELKG